MTDVLLQWSSGVITPAEGELSDEEISKRYGVLMENAVSAFQADPNYIVEMAESAAQLRYKREMWQARTEAAQQTSCKEEIRELTLSKLEARGVHPPVRSSKRKRDRAA